ncbi:nuclear transport factor 2 family protein [Rhodanobacter sp. Si-c]|uniref:Nuclear transport factor 2 family protein n=1 Tax=Rhodanobacter lycopersici TaxID=3162487 RepID=A0ABV3QI13_9GAMM
MIRNIVVLLALTLTSSLSFAAEQPATDPSSVDDVKQVTVEFQAALAKKDRDSLLALFLNDSVPVMGVASDKTIARIRLKKADAAKVVPSTSGKFVDSIVGDAAASREIFSNVRIHSDGAVASVYFDFVFESNGEPQNIGSESWLLTRTDQGWKISGIVYSMNFPEKK